MSKDRMTIELATKFLQLEAERYKKEYDRIIAEKKAALENARKSFIGQALQNELDRIEKKFGEELIAAKHEALKSVEVLNELREQEKAEVQGINRDTIEKINTIKDVPMTEDEFVALMDDVRVTSNYWAKRSLMNIAEKNNIDPVKTGIGADYALKLNVLSQLESQMAEIVEKYPCEGIYSGDRPKVLYANLADNVCDNAIRLYGGTVDLRTETAKAQKAILFIKAQQTDMNKALAISNAFRNSKTNENRNAMLYALATDSSISPLSLQMSGIYGEIEDFKNGKITQYAAACNAMEKVRKATEKDTVEMVKAEQGSNTYFAEMYADEIKKNEFLKSFASPLVDNVPGEVAEADGKKIDAE